MNRLWENEEGALLAGKRALTGQAGGFIVAYVPEAPAQDGRRGGWDWFPFGHPVGYREGSNWHRSPQGFITLSVARQSGRARWRVRRRRWTDGTEVTE